MVESNHLVQNWRIYLGGFPGGSVVKNLPAVLETQEIQSLDQEDPWSWQPTPAFLPGKSHEQRSLAAYSPWDCKESDTA